MAKQGSKGSAAGRQAAGSRRRKASRPPVIDLEAVEVASGDEQAPPPAPDKATATPRQSAPDPSPKTARAEPVRPRAEKTTQTGAPPPEGDGSFHRPGEMRADKPAGIGPLVLAAGAGALIFLIAVLAVRLTEQEPASADGGLRASLDRLGAKIDQLEQNAVQPANGQRAAAGQGGAARAAAQAAQAVADAAARKVGELETRLELLTKSGAAIPDGARIADIAARLKTLEASATSLRGDLAAVGSRQGAVETALAGAKDDGGALPAAFALRLNDQATQLAALKRQLAAAESARGDGDLQQRVEELSGAIASLRATPGSDVSGKLAETGRTMANITTRVADLEAAHKALSETNAGERRDAVTGLSARIEAAETSLAGLRKTRLAAASLLIARLEGAVRSGAPFGDDLAVLRALVPDLKALAALAPFAEQGLPGLTKLRDGFAALAGKLAGGNADKAGTLIERLVAQASTIVTVRRSGSTLTDSKPVGAVGEIAVRLRAGDLEGAYRTGQGLDPRRRKIAQPWLRDLANAVSADEALRQARAWVRDALGSQQKSAPAGSGKAE